MQDKMEKRKTVHAHIVAFFIVSLFLAAILSCTGCGRNKEDDFEELTVSDVKSDGEEEFPEEAADPQKEDQEEDRAGQTVYVYVCGAVQAPGVYELMKNARVYEAIELAGGLTEEASAESVNQARTVSDGEQLYVPTVQEAEAQGIGVGEGIVTEGTDEKRVNINTAGKEELMTLTGIGEAKAQSILDYREEHGSFASIEDLMQIEGIKEGVFNKIKEDIMI